MINKILDKLFFHYIIKKEMMRDEDRVWLRDHSAHLMRICESMKSYIASTTFSSITLREHQRRKDWFDCISTIQRLAGETKDNKSIDWLTAKESKKK